MSEEYPLISAIMLVCHKDHKYVHRAIKCFEDQNYPYKELLIVNNCDTQLQASELSLDARPNVYMLDTPLKLTAGMAKNYGLSACNGQIIAQFDCDCYHAPDRLLKQAIALFENNASICVLTKCLKYSYISGQAGYWSNDQNAILNSMMYIRPKNIDYENLDKQEEKSLMQRMLSNNLNAVSLLMPELMLKLIGDDVGDELPLESALDEASQVYIKSCLKTIS